VKIITWNVNGIRACASKGLWTYLANQDPDLLCLQETKAHPDQVVVSPAEVGGRHAYWSSALRRGYSGVLTLSRREADSVEYGIGIRKFDSEGRFVIADFPEFRIYNMYFPNGGSGPERHEFKQEFLARFLRHLALVLKSGRQVIVVGDYNVAYLDEDVYDPTGLAGESGFLPEERQWFREFLKAGMVDAFRHLHPHERNKFTWWSYQDRARITNRGWRIDHVCVSQGLVSRLKRAEIHDHVEGSDHCPVLVELT
jgi:exodeoxyribonuclease-3